MPTLSYDYTGVPTIRDFAKSNKFVRGILGPFGCIAPGTKVVTEEGLLPIEQIDRQVRVLSWNADANRFQFSLSGGAFPKGRDYLYRISTRQGEWRAAGHHRVLCGDGEYRRVDHVRPGDELCQGDCEGIEKRSILSVVRETSKEDYWDLQVLNTNNYVTEDGSIHHNSGKSSGCVIEMFRRSMAQEPSPDGIRRTRWAVIRNTYRQLEDTTIRTFKDWFPVDTWGVWREKDMTYRFTAIPNMHCEVLFRALDRPDQVNNLLSLELTGAWANEAREIPKEIIDAVQGRVGRYPAKKDGGCTWSGLMLDTNPPDDDSWWYEIFEENCPSNHAVFKQPSGLSLEAENIENLPEGYYTNLAQGKSEQFVKVYIHGQYGSVQDGQAIYKDEWNDTLHVKEFELDPNSPILIGMDFGLTPAAVIGQQTPMGRLQIRHELTSTGMGARRFIRTALKPFLREHYPNTSYTLIGDPAGTRRSEGDEKSAFMILNEEGVFPIAAITNDPTMRWDAVKWYLSMMADGQPAFMLHPECKALRKGFNGGYRLRRLQLAGEARYENKADKNKYSHCHDAAQYLALHAKGSVTIGSANDDSDFEPDAEAVY